MFIVKVKLTHDDFGGVYESIVDLYEEDFKDEEELKQHVFDESGWGDEDEMDIDDCDMDAGDPAECSLEEAFEYIEWASQNSYRDAEEIVKAAAYLDIKAEDIDECYEGYYRSDAAFAQELAEQMGAEIPDWITVDWQATWESSLRFDYSESNGHYFRSI